MIIALAILTLTGVASQVNSYMEIKTVAAHAATMNAVTNQRAYSRELARLAALAANPSSHTNPTETIQQKRAQLIVSIDEVDRLLGALSGDAGASEVRRVMAEMAPERRRLLDNTVSPITSEQSAAVQQAFERLAPGFEATTAELQRINERDSHAAVRHLLVVMVIDPLVLLLLFFLVIEPSIRVLRRQHESMLTRSNDFERLALVAQRTKNAVIFTDAQRKIVWANEGFTRLTGFSLEEVRGKSPGHLLQFEKTDAAVVAQMRAALVAGGDFSGELLNRGRDGREYWLSIEIQALHDPTGKLAGFMAIETDVTELKAASDRAASASRAKSEFLATMSHEIRTPMNGVLGFTSLLLDTPLSAQQREWLTTIKHSGEALLTVLNDVLDFSKIEAGKVSLERLPFDFTACVNEVLELFGPRAKELGLALTVTRTSDVPKVLVTDPNRLRQVLLNLVSNAVKFTPRGSVLLDIDTVLSARGREVRVRVRDTGIGIPLEKQATLFTHFTQADASTTRRYGGTGLGLAISKRLIELLGGEMGVQSAHGEGACFWFTLPLIEGVLPEERPPTPAPATVEARVLVAEDNPVNQKLVRALLGKLGCEVELAADGREAVGRFLAGRFDLVLLDFHMPGLDGIEAARAIRQHEHDHQLPPTPLIALTASVLQTDHDRCLEAGMDEFLSKPVTLANLGRVLSKFAIKRSAA